MGGHDNKTSIEAGHAKTKSLDKHLKKNRSLHEEYMEDGWQFRMSFDKFKQTKNKWKRKNKS